MKALINNNHINIFLTHGKYTDILSDFQIFMTFCQFYDILSVHIICEILFESNKISNQAFPATHIFNPSFEIPANKKNLTLFLFDSNKFRFWIPIKALPAKTLSTKMKQKCFAHPSEQAKQIQTKTDLL